MRIEDIVVGSIYEFERMVTNDDILRFAELTGDHSPLHVDPVFAARTPYKKPIAHGMFAGSLFSTIVGMHCPGEQSVYLKQTVSFHLPIFSNDRLLVRGVVVHKSDTIGVIRVRTEIWRDDDLLIDGEAIVKVASYDE